MTEAIQDDKPLDESLLNQDLNGAAAPKKGGALSIKGTPREGGARLSKNFKKIAFVGGSVVVGGMVIGILTAGNKSQPAESSGTTAMVGQTSPDVAAMQRAAQQHLGGPVAASSDPTGNAASAPVGAASSPGAPLNHPNNPGAALHASGEPPQLTPAQKYRRWLIEQHYKNLEGAVLADQSAHLPQLNDAAVRAAKPTPGKTTRLYDSGGLYLDISPTGSKAWRLKYRYNGRENRISLGAYPMISLKEARQQRDDARRQQEQIDATNSFQTQALEWFERQKTRWVDSHARDVERRLQANLFPDLGPLPIDRITPVQVLETLRKMENRGAVDLAHRVMQVASQVFRYAIACGRCTVDPTAGLRGALTPHVQKHQPAIEPDELPALLRAMDQYAGQGGEAQTQRALQFLALTFVRTKELVEAPWDEIDLEQGRWLIDASRMKMKRDFLVPLSTQATALLREQQRTCRNSLYVWPGRNIRVPMSNNTLLFALYRLGYRSKMTGHGFRAVASTILNEQGWRHDVIEKQLAHEPENRVRAAYNRAEYLPERVRMMQWWADHLDALRQGRAAQPPVLQSSRLFVVNSGLTP